MASRNYYDTLELAPTATPEEVTASYRLHVAAWHPDKHTAATKQRAEAKMQQINEAYRVLSDPQLRRAYDAQLKVAHFIPSPDTLTQVPGINAQLPSVVYDRVADLLVEGQTAKAAQELIRNMPGIATVQIAKMLRYIAKHKAQNQNR